MDRFIRALAALSLVTLVTLPMTPAYADSGYIGAGFGWTRGDLGAVEETADTVDDESMAVRLFAGYRPFRFLAVEIFYEDFSSYAATSGTTIVRTETDVYGAAVLGIIPIGAAEFFAKFGVSRWDTEAEIEDAGVLLASDRGKASEPVYGIGLHVSAKNMPAGIRLEYERYADVSEVPGVFQGADIGVFSASFVYNF